jgi:hypothetical protein
MHFSTRLSSGHYHLLNPLPNPKQDSETGDPNSVIPTEARFAREVEGPCVP